MTDSLSSLSPSKRALLDRLKRGARVTSPEGSGLRLIHAEPIWAAELILGPGDRHHLSLVYSLGGALDPRRMDSAMRKLAQAHTILASRIVSNKDGLTAEPCAPPRVQLLPEDEPDAVAEFARQPFDFSNSLWRVGMQVCGATTHLVITLHHLIADAQSLAIAARQLCAAYNGAELSSPRASLAVQSDIESLRYFEGRLAGHSSALDLPWPDPDAIDQFSTASAVRLDRPEDLCAHVGGLELSEFETLFCCTALALSALSDKPHETICVAADARQIGEENSIGCFAILVPVRVALDPSMKVSEAVKQLVEQLRADLARRDCSFTRIAQAVGAGPDAPLVQTVLSVRTSAPPVLTFDQIEARPTVIDPLEPQFPLLIDLARQASQDWEMKTTSANAKTSPHVAGQVNSLIVSFVRSLGKNVERSVNDVCQEAIAAYAPDPHRDEASFESTPPQLESLLNFDTHPGAWVRCGESIMEPQALQRAIINARAAIAAHRRRHSGRIGLSAQRTRELPIWLMALLSEAASFVVIDPESPSEELKARCKAAGITGFCGAGGPESTPRITVDLSDDVVFTPPKSAAPDAEAYALFTSGSTGKPKLVRVPRSALANLLAGVVQYTGFGEASTVLSATSPVFDIALLELLAPIIFGAGLEVADQVLARDAIGLTHRLQTLKPTVFQSTPSRLRSLIAAGWDGHEVDQIWSGGEPLTHDLAMALGPCMVFNFFGPTETTIWSTAGRVDAGPIHVGHPLPGQRVYVLNRHGCLLPDGWVGEIAIGGRGVGLGYDQDPRRTAAAFQIDPVKPERGKIYRTGDRGRRLPDGRIIIHGRWDDQVKVRGARIELGEVDACLSALPGVKAGAAWVVRGPQGAQLHAAWVPDGEVEDINRVVREGMAPRLAPSRLFAVDALPLLRSGKLDRKALARLSDSAPAEQEAMADTAEPSQQMRDVLDAFQHATGGTRFHVDQDFFLHGGDSIAMVRVLVFLAERTGVSISASEMLDQGRTARDLAELVASRSSQEDMADQILTEIENLSADDIATALKAERNADNG